MVMSERPQFRGVRRKPPATLLVDSYGTLVRGYASRPDAASTGNRTDRPVEDRVRDML
jgi:hypothetical protein